MALNAGHEPSMFVDREKEAMYIVSIFFALKRNSYVCFWRACLEDNPDDVDDGNSASHEPNYGMGEDKEQEDYGLHVEPSC